MALGQRLPDTSLVHHSDRGCQYASERYQQLLDQRGIRCSMSRRGDCWDNAVVESFFATLKSELLDRRPWPTHREARLAIHEYIGVFYNPTVGTPTCATPHRLAMSKHMS
jgi:putative transposase